MALRVANSDEEAIYAYYLDLKERNVQNDVDLLGNGKGLNKMMFYFVVDYFNKNNFPIVLSDDEYYNLDAIEVYHGFKNYKHCANMLWDFLYHYGEGVWGSGIYVSDTRNEALYYTREDGVIDNNKVMKMKICSNNIIDYKTVKNLCNYVLGINEVINDIDLPPEKKERLDKLMNFIETTCDPQFRFALATDRATIATILGFDAIVKSGDKKKKTTHYIMLNRGKLVVPESVYRWHMQNAGGEYFVHSEDVEQLRG